VPAKIAQSSWTPLELALKQVTNAETLEVLKAVREPCGCGAAARLPRGIHEALGRTAR
jgi:hypothetical protein